MNYLHLQCAREVARAQGHKKVLSPDGIYLSGAHHACWVKQLTGQKTQELALSTLNEAPDWHFSDVCHPVHDKLLGCPLFLYHNIFAHRSSV